MSVLDWFRPMLGGDQDPTQSWDAMQQGTAGTAAPPGVLNYLQDVITGRAANSFGSTYDPNRSLRENVLDPRAIEQAMSMVGPGVMRGVKVKGPPQISLDTTDAQLSRMYPMAGERVDGRLVRPDVPNLSSIESSFTNPEELSGVRMVPMSYFEPGPAAPVTPRVQDLAAQIRKSRELNPLIVGHDEAGPYIVEGGHRYDALQLLKAKAFPARVVLDIDALPETLDQFSRAGPSIGEGRTTVANKLTDLLRRYP